MPKISDLSPDEKISTLIDRCKSASINCEKKSMSEREYIVLHLPNGRQIRPLVVWPLETSIDTLIGLPFEKYVYLGEYDAIVSYDDQVIEAAILSVRGASRSRIASAFSLPSGVDDDDDGGTAGAVRFSMWDDNGEWEISIGPSSEIFNVLCRGRIDTTISIRGALVKTHDGALDLLERLTNALFFQVDLARGITLALQRDTRRRRPRRVRRRDDSPLPIEFPKSEYDAAPITLYWYGRSSLGMPLLQFLAFYQCVEFYFPMYFQAEQKRRIRNILKNPTFRPDRETDIGRVLAAISGPNRKGLPDERTMLRATLQECIDRDELRKYLEEDEDRQKFFTQKAKGLTDVKIPIRSPDTDLRDFVADRIYDIRCKVVHTKSDLNDEIELLLPFSKEAQQLEADIGLMQFIAQKVLIAGSTPLKMISDKVPRETQR